jgi:hypothetical protein
MIHGRAAGIKARRFRRARRVIEILRAGESSEKVKSRTKKR